MHATEVCCINCLFEKGVDGNYTKSGLLYQDILEYFDIRIHKKNSQNIEIHIDPTSFTPWTLTKWLLKKNLEFVKYYSGLTRYMTNTMKILNRVSTVESFVKDLEALGLIGQTGVEKASKNKMPMPVYSITQFGTITLSLIKYSKTDNDKHKRLLRDLILISIQNYFLRYNSHIGDFIAKLYSRSIKAGFSSSMIDLLLTVTHSNKHTVRTLVDAFNEVLHAHLMNKQTRNKFVEIWVKTIKEFPDPVQRIIIYHEKAEIESRIHLAQPPKEWEEAWINNIHNYALLTLYGVCSKCSNKYPVIVEYYDYRREILFDGTVKRNCYKCSDQNTLAISTKIS